ncbi:hypothetical protein [Kitasatospora sp. NPDC001527]|uniref:phthiocerol/phthiodiolone dimycocerosyl transferase family protein n=1 Tax=Kitasatospora sp. NPDC001527 TaxID=3154519 RepID=UPI00332A2122
MTSERRSLTFFESLFYSRRVGPVVASVRLEGPVDASVMDRAARLLQRDHPLLRCSLLRTDDDVALVLSDEAPGLAVAAPDANSLADELNVPLPGNRPLSRISLSRTADSAVLSLAGDHAGTDGRLNTLLLRRLLGYYTDLSRGVEPAPSGRSAFEGSLEEALLAAYEPGPVRLPAETAPPLTLAGEPGEPGEPGPQGVHGLGYDRDTTAALVAAARKGGISLTSLLAGALACAVRARFPGAGRMPVSAAFAVDLRPRVTPPIPPDAPFCCVARLVSATDVDAGERPVEVGRRIGTKLKALLEQEEIQHRLVAQRLAGTPTPLPPMSFMVSNIGVIEDHPVPDGLRITDSRWAGTSRGPVPSLYGSTADGRLTLDLVHDTAFHSAEVIGDVIGHFEASLMSAASDPGAETT